MTVDELREEATPSEPDDSGRATNGLRVGLIAVVTLVAFESLAVITILPVISDDLDGVSWYGWVTSAFFLGTMLGIVFAGDQANRRGPAFPYTTGLILFAVGLLIGGLAPTMPILVIGRALQGFGAGAVPALGYIVIGQAFTETQRPRMFAWLSTAWVVPGLVGPALAERVATHAHWRIVFLGLLPLVIVAGIFVVHAVRHLGPLGAVAERAPFWRRRIVEAARVAGGAALIVGGFNAGGWWILAGLIAGVAIGVGSLARLTPDGTLRGRAGLPMIVLTRGLLTFAFFGTDTFVPFAITDGRGRSTFSASVAVTTFTVAWTAAAWVQQRYITQLGERLFVRLGFCIAVPAIALVMLGSSGALPYWMIHVGWTFAGSAMGFAYSALSQLLLRSTTTSEYGAATASLQLLDNLGIALGAGAVGVIVAIGDDRGWHPGSSVTLALIPTITVAVAGIAATRRLPGKQV